MQYILGHAASLLAAAGRGRGGEMWAGVLEQLDVRGLVGDRLQARASAHVPPLCCFPCAPPGWRAHALAPCAGGWRPQDLM